MKKTTLLLLLTSLISTGLMAQGKSKSNVDDIRMKIIEKANKLNLKPINSTYYLNYQPLSASDQGLFVYYVDFSNYTAAIYCRSNRTEPYAVWGDIFAKYSKFNAVDI